MAGTRLLDFMDALVTDWRSPAGYGSPDEQGVIPVYDGVAESGEVPDLYVVVGAYDIYPDDDADDLAGTATGTWRTIPLTTSHAIAESITVPCAVVARSGEAEWSAMRSDIGDVLDDLDSSIRNSAGVGDVAGQVTVNFTDGRLRQVAYSDGYTAVFEFTISAELTR